MVKYYSRLPVCAYTRRSGIAIPYAGFRRLKPFQFLLRGRTEERSSFEGSLDGRKRLHLVSAVSNLTLKTGASSPHCNFVVCKSALPRTL